MTANHVRTTLGIDDEDGSPLRLLKDFISGIFRYGHIMRKPKDGIEDDIIFRGYYYRILIRHTRITFGLLSIMFVVTGFFFLDPLNPAIFAAHLVFAMIAVVSLGVSFLSFFRMVWKVYVLFFASAALIIVYWGSQTISTTIEVAMIALITVCLMSGLPFGLTFLLAIFNMIIYEVVAHRNGMTTLGMLRSNSFFSFFVAFLMYAAHSRVKGIRTQFETLETVKLQRRKSDSIIQHMLPPFVVQKLKAKHDSVIVDHFDSVTVMFCEIVNFNALLEMMPAQEVVQLLNDIYTAFDKLTDVHGVNKVEHIGNVYVVSAGCPEVTPYHSGRVAEMGLKMLSVVRHFRKVELRLGIHTGAVMAGVIGFKKLSYHLFGDTINTASRMCSHGAIQRIHVSEATYQLLSAKYLFESRGEISVKGKGVMHTYFLDGRKINTQGGAYAHAHVSNFVQERDSFVVQAEAAFPPTRPSSNSFFRPFGVGALVSEYSQSSGGSRTHRSSFTVRSPDYVAARPSTATLHEMPRSTGKPLLQSILSFLGTPNHTPIEMLEEEGVLSNSRYKKNIFTLRFSGEDGIETAFRDRNADTHHTRMCCSMLFCLVGFAFCGVYDHYFAMGPKTPYYLLRFLFCGLGLACIGVAIKLRQHVEYIAILVLSGTLFATLAIEVWGHRNAPLSLTTVVLTMFITSMTFNVSCVRFIYSTVIHLIGFALFEFLQLIQMTPALDMALHSSFVVSALVMNMVACYMQERYERNNWVHELVLDDEIDKTDALLTGLLPVSVLVELKEGRQLIADEFDQVSIMLTDIVGFTEIASRITSSQLVEMLNVLFSVFDRLAQKYEVLKIATIGDAYLCIAGCPEKTDDHAERIANMALEMVESVKSIIAPDGTQVRVRIGMHTGPVIAGVVGIKMIHYQIWGDSVQIAQKMESSGKASHIHVSKDAHALLEKNFIFEPADVVKIKNSDMATYFLKDRMHPKRPLIAVKRGYTSIGPNTPRIVDLSSSMIFQNAGAWTMKRPSSPPLHGLSQSQRILSARRYPRTPRRADMLTPLPSGRTRAMSMLVTSSSRVDSVEFGESQEVTPSYILDNILGMNNFHDTSSELSPLDHSDYEDDVISNDEFAILGKSPSITDKPDEIVVPIPNFSFSNSLRLTSLVVSPQPTTSTTTTQQPLRFPPSPSGPNLAITHPFSPYISPSPLARVNDPLSRPRSDSFARAGDAHARPRSDSLSPTSEHSPRPRSDSFSMVGELPMRGRSNSLSRTAPRDTPAYASDLLAYAGSLDYSAARAEPRKPHLILQVNIPPPSVPFAPKSPLSHSPLCKDSFRIPLHEPGDIKPAHPPEVV